MRLDVQPALPIKIPHDRLTRFCLKYRVAKLSLFGSVLREDFTAESDIDFLVEFQAGYIPTFLVLAEMEEELSEFLEGRRIDLRTPGELSPYFRDRVMAEARVQYECD